MEAFERFWREYPKRLGSNPKEPARLKFMRHVASGVDAEWIVAGAQAYARQMAEAKNIETEFVAMAQTWLNQKRWQDYPKDLPVMKVISDEEFERMKARYEQKLARTL